MAKKKTIAVRLEGGIGDHVLGLRLLPFIKKKYPVSRIIIYSDAGGHVAPADAAQLSPLIDDLVLVFHKKGCPAQETWGRLENIRPQDLFLMRKADLFFDAWGQGFYAAASQELGVPFSKILESRPRLKIPSESNHEALQILGPYGQDRIFIGLNVGKYRYELIKEHSGRIRSWMRQMLKDPRVVILNFMTTAYSFPHWPKEMAAAREAVACAEDRLIGALWNIDRRVVPVMDQKIATVSALLAKCRYFIGVDNGIKHLAWALGIPHTYFVAEKFDLPFILRWMPDFERSILFDAPEVEFRKHVREAKQQIQNPKHKAQNKFKI